MLLAVRILLGMRLRAVAPVLALTTSLLLAGCGDDPEPSPTASGSSAPADDAPADDAPADDAPAAGDLPDGCTLVPRDLVEETLGVDPGEGTPGPSSIGGPDNCDYAGIFATVQVTPDADTYLTGSSFEPDGVEGAQPAPAPADRGYVVRGAFAVIKGSVGVFVFSADPQDSTEEQWAALAQAVADQLP